MNPQELLERLGAQAQANDDIASRIAAGPIDSAPLLGGPKTGDLMAVLAGQLPQAPEAASPALMPQILPTAPKGPATP